MHTPQPNAKAQALRGSPLVAGLSAGILALSLTLLLPNTYKSEVIILPKGANASPLAALAATAAFLGGGGFGQIDEEAHYVDIVKSRFMADQLLDTVYTFQYQPWYFGQRRSKQESLATFLEVRTGKDREDAIETVLEWVNCRRDFTSGMLRVSAEAPSPQLAQQLADKAAEYLNRTLRNRIRSQGSVKAAYAKDLADQARRDEEAARRDLAAFARSHVNFAYSPDPGVRTQGETLIAEKNLRRQVVSSLTLGYEQAALEANNNAPLLSVLMPAYLPLVRANPNRPKITVLATLAGFLAMIGWRRRRLLMAKLLGHSPDKRSEDQRLLV